MTDKKFRCPGCNTTNVGVLHCSDTEKTVYCRGTARPFCPHYTTTDNGKTWKEVPWNYECEEER